MNHKDIVEKAEALGVSPEEFHNVQTKFEAYTGAEPYLFVSYSHRNIDKVYPILDLLHERKYRIWYDESCETGDDFRDELREKIEGCDAVLLFVCQTHGTGAVNPVRFARFRPRKRDSGWRLQDVLTKKMPRRKPEKISGFLRFSLFFSLF